MASSPDHLPFETASVIRLIRDFLQHNEAAGMHLWDLSADESAAGGLLRLQLLPALSAHLAAFLTTQAKTASSSPPPTATQQLEQQQKAAPVTAPTTAVAPARLVEICCGILANLFSCPAVVPLLLADAELAALLEALPGVLIDPPALSELCRLFSAAVSTPQGCSIWLPVLLQPHSLAWLLHIISNALHPLLLQRSLELAAVLLAVGEDAAAGADADAAHPAQDGSPSIQQEQQQSGQRPPQAAQCTASAANQLLQQGLMPALHAVLAPAAAPGAKLQAYSTTSAAQTHPAAAAAEGGSWSDEDNDGGGGAADEEKGTVQSRVYEQPDVLMALLSALEQLGQQPDTVAAAMQQLPELPELLLQLLLACHAREQQEVLETLLPVLVLFRVGVLAVLQPAACEEQQQQQQQEQKRCIQCLQLWACIAGVLLDSAPDSLDARDAAWYLLAAVSPSFERVFAGISAVYAASSCLQQQVQLLRRCVSEGGAPDTSRGYAQQCDRALCTALPQLLPAEEEAE